MKRSFPLLSLLLTFFLILFFSACSGGSSGSSQTSSSGTAATSTTPSVSLVYMTSYQAQAYTINYPKDWAKTVVGDNVTFTDTGAQKGYFALTEIPNPNAFTPISAGITGSINGLKATYPNNFAIDQLPATTTINGITWNQGGASGTSASTGRSIKAVVLGTDYPAKSANTKFFLVIYSADTSNFTQMLSSAFQPMMNSLKFTS